MLSRDIWRTERHKDGLQHLMQPSTVWVKKSPCGFLTFSPKRLGIFNQFLYTYYTFFSTLDYKFLFNYLQLWRSYNILSATTQRIFTFHYKFGYWAMTSLLTSCHIRHVCWHYKSDYFIVTCHRQRSTKPSTTYAIQYNTTHSFIKTWQNAS